MNGRSSKAAGVTKFRLKRVASDTNGRMQNARYSVDGLRTQKQDADGNSSREYGVGISTSASTPLTPNSTAPSISYISGHMILGAEINGEFVYHLGDALSTVRDVVDDEGDVIRSFEFDEYGNMLSSSGSGAASPKTWIGGVSVNDDRADSGLWNMGHRNYAAGVLGRFISKDPIGHAGNLNLYAYPTNPVTMTDADGLHPVTAANVIWTVSSTNSAIWDSITNSLKFKLQGGMASDEFGETSLYRTESGDYVIRVVINNALSRKDQLITGAHECVHVIGSIERSRRGPDGIITGAELIDEEVAAYDLTQALRSLFGVDSPEMNEVLDFYRSDCDIGKGREHIRAYKFYGVLDTETTTVRKKTQGTLKLR